MARVAEVTVVNSDHAGRSGRVWSNIIVFLFFLHISLPVESNDNHSVMLQPSKPSQQLSSSLAPIEANLKSFSVGVIKNGPAPYTVFPRQYVWEGITADFVAIAERALHAKANPVIFDNREAALAALARGQVDMLGEENNCDAAANIFPVSKPYASNTPLLVGLKPRLGERRLNDVAGTIAIVSGTIQPTLIQEWFPGTDIKEYGAISDAFQGISNREVQWLLVDAVSVSYYLRSADYFDLIPRLPMDIAPIKQCFAFSKQATQLAGKIDQVFGQISRAEQASLLRFWGWSEIEQASKPELSLQEKQWIEQQHPTIRFILNEGRPPYTYLDKSGEFSGVVPELLSEITLRTGVQFDIISMNARSDIINAFDSGKADMVANVIPPKVLNEGYYYSRPYITANAALVSATGSGLTKFSDMKGHRLAMSTGSELSNFIIEHYPDINIINADSPLQALTMVVEGEADAAVGYMLTVKYLAEHYFTGALTVGEMLPGFSGNMSFAISKKYEHAEMLTNVINKAILDLGVGYAAKLSQQWGESDADENSVLIEYFHERRYLIVAGSGIILFMFIWVVFLYIQRTQRHAELKYWKSRGEQFDGVPQPIVVRDHEGRFIHCNHFFYTFFGLSSESVIGARSTDIAEISVDDGADSTRHYQQLLAAGKGEVREVTLTLQQRRFHMREWSVPHTKNGKVVGLITGWIDLTAVSEMAQDLKIARDQAIEAGQAKSRFLAVMSHEIRTPLNAIIGLLEMVLKKADRDNSWDRQSLEVAHSSSRSLVNLIGDILDLSKIEAGHWKLSASPVLIDEVIGNAVMVFMGVARQKGLYLNFSNAFDEPQCYYLDGNALKQILTNLLSNAIKFTQQGGVTLVFRPASQHGGFCIEVNDTGCGIALAEQEAIFSPFEQANSVPSADHEGTGLGLAICKQLCQLMDGQISLVSEVGKGTSIAVEFNAKKMMYIPDGHHRSSEETPGRLRILLVDDHSANRFVLAQQLAFLGHEYLEAEHGEAAFTHYLATEIDVVITDCNMPVMNGYELTKKIRQHELTSGKRRCFIVGFTANAQSEEREHCLAVGMDKCLFKPISVDELQYCLHDLAYEQGDTLNIKYITELTRGDQHILARLVDEMLRSNEIDMQDLIAASDAATINKVVHRVKGAARIVQTIRLVTCCDSYEAGTLGKTEVVQCMQQLHSELQSKKQALADSATVS